MKKNFEAKEILNYKNGIDDLHAGYTAIMTVSLLFIQCNKCSNKHHLILNM